MYPKRHLIPDYDCFMVHSGTCCRLQDGAPTRSRTEDFLLTREALYRLSHGCKNDSSLINRFRFQHGAVGSLCPYPNAPDFYRTPSPRGDGSVVTNCRDTAPNPIGSIKQAPDAPQRQRITLKTWSGRRDFNPRSQRWRRCAVALSYARDGTLAPTRTGIGWIKTICPAIERQG